MALSRRWDYLIARNGGPSFADLGPEPEITAHEWLPTIERCLNWQRDSLQPVVQPLVEHGLRWLDLQQAQPPCPEEAGQVKRLEAALIALAPVLASRLAVCRRLILEQRWQAIIAVLEPGAASEVGRALLQAVREGDPERYRAAWERLQDLYRRHSAWRRRAELLARLEQVAPAWAGAIRARQGLHGCPSLPGDPVVAWLWRQLNDELDKRSRVSIQALQDDLIRVGEELREVTANLVECRTWAYQIRRTTLEQRQALIGWLNTVRRIGRGTGRRAQQLRAEAARLMARAHSAVPVWIMPLARVVEHYDPRTTRFDVVIIDEASQSDALALITFAMADQVVVVGDHEQVSPEGVGRELAQVDALIREYLVDIPNAHLYDYRRSVYDIARESAGGVIMLVEHFRCVPEIIQFSNWLSYNGRIRPLRDASQVVLKPHVVPYRVQSWQRDGEINWGEVEAIVSLLAACLEQPEYHGKTFGVVSLLGARQAEEIDRRLRMILSPADYVRHRILCGTSAQFQGDERDVVFLSLVDTPDLEGPLPMRQDDRFKQRFNVAASRARDQLWVVYSLDPSRDLKPGDLRRRLIEYALDPAAIVRTLTVEESRAQSEFERQVLQRLMAAGYRVRAQFPVGAYRIDLVVEGGGQRVAIECDGDRYHPPERLTEDLERQAILERLGWRFLRIRGSEFFRNPDQALARVCQRLADLGVVPEGPDIQPSPPISSLLDRVKARAAALRATLVPS